MWTQRLMQIRHGSLNSMAAVGHLYTPPSQNVLAFLTANITLPGWSRSNNSTRKSDSWKYWRVENERYIYSYVLVGGFFTAIFGGWDSALVTPGNLYGNRLLHRHYHRHDEKIQTHRKRRTFFQSRLVQSGEKVCTLMLIVVAVQLDILLNTNYIRNNCFASALLEWAAFHCGKYKFNGDPVSAYQSKKQLMLLTTKIGRTEETTIRRTSNMAILRPDTTFGGVTVNEYLLTKHN